LGAAYLAGLAVGYWKDIDEVQNQWQAERKFEPENANTDQIAQEKAGWIDAMKRTLTKDSKIKL
ncbi:MAG: glycerol kinase, partial [Prevotella sp.]|nr:glycerol kinase [Prevotella sp.]